MALAPKTFKAIIAAHITRANKDHAKWDKWRAWYRSEFWDSSAGEDGSLLIENNYLYAFCDTMVASICPPNPQVTCDPRKSDDKTKLAARYREALINDALYRTDAYKLLWRMSTLASVYPRSFMKTVWNFARERPDFLVLDPRFVFYDMSVSRWEDVRYVIEVTTITKQEFNKRAKPVKGNSDAVIYDAGVSGKATFGTLPKWLKDSEQTSAADAEKISDTFEWVTIYEVYDFTADRYYHMLEDFEDPLFEGDLPYVFVRNPFTLLAFNDNLSDIGGLADSQLVERQQRRLNELDTLELRHAQASIPVTVINEALCDNPEDFVDQVANATSPGDVVRLQGKNAAPLGDIIGATPTAGLIPEFMDIRDRIEASIQFVLGIPEYARGVAGTSDIATELALVDSAMRTRLGRRTKLINGVIKHMATSTIGLYEEFLDDTREIPVRVTGEREAIVVAREHLSARSVVSAETMKQEGETIEEPLEIDYEVVPFSPTENSKSAQIKKLQPVMEMLLQIPAINQHKLLAHILDLFDVRADVLKSEEELEQEAAAAAAPPPGAPGAAPPGGEDILAAGGVPAGVPEGPPTEAIGAMAGGAGHPSP
tara:strand:- start:212 stop:2002 length:1791 start_codon:yes stop_codon:yes gene_type:complete